MACCGVVLSALMARAEDAGSKETTRRMRKVEEAQELLRKGDEAYKAAHYEQAIEAFAGARETLPDAPLTAELSSVATERLVTASVERARELSRKGDVAGAKKVMDRVLAEGVAPDDPAARRMRAQLDDPARTNPALTAKLGGEVDQVRRLLYTAEGSFNLGKYDEAVGSWQKVLRIDPTNKAARRGMERAALAKSDYLRAAYDETRAAMLGGVDVAWESQLADDHAANQQPGADASGIPAAAGAMSVAAKLERIVVPLVDFTDTSLVEAVDALRARSVELDDTELDQARKGVLFVIETGAADSEAGKRARDGRFSLKLRGVPLGKVLNYIGQAAGFRWSVEEYAVVFRTAGSMSKDMINRTYRVPPDFLSTSGGQTAGGEAKPSDPFAEKPAKEEGLLAKRLTARQVLESYGVTFAEGASASFNPANSSLVVRNTPDMHLLIDQIVETVSTTEPVQVMVRVNMMKVEERRLKELGFDWLLGTFGVGGKLVGGGGTTGNGSALDDILNAPGSTSSGTPVTAGNRSGAQAVPGDSLDALLSAQDTGFTGTPQRAPGVMTFNGLLHNTQFATVMRGLNQATGVDFVAAPSVVTRSAQRATIQVIREFTYPTEYERPQLPNTVGNLGGGAGNRGAQSSPITPATPTAFQKREIGMALEVEPTVSADRRFVDVRLNPSLTELDGFVNYGSPIMAQVPVGLLGVGGSTAVEVTPNRILMPVFSVNRANTALTVADGSTVVIGGLLQQKLVEVQDSVPVLGRLPLVGRLFQSKVSAPSRKVVVFFVTVELVDPSGHPYRQR